MKVFLGGTCNDSTWRQSIIPFLKMDYFNPVVEDWAPECQEEELRQREECDYCLYFITPQMTGVYSIAEVVDDSHLRPSKTLFCYMSWGDEVFNGGQIRSLEMVGKMVARNGGRWFSNPLDLINFLNNAASPLPF